MLRHRAETDTRGVVTGYSYDALNRLANGSGGQADDPYPNYCWNYDSFGNRLGQISASGAFVSTAGGPTSNACTVNGAQGPSIWAQYNGTINGASNNQMSGTSQNVNQGQSYDPSGNITYDGVTSYLYDGEGTSMTQYLYDAEGNRVAKGYISTWSCNTTVNGFKPQSAYVLDPNGEQLTEMSNQSGAWQWVHTNVEAGGLSATYDADLSDKTEGWLYFHLSDWLGTRRQQTDYAGNPCLNFTGLPYGDVQTTILVSSTDAADATEHHFTGKERDTESGNDYFGARYYASSMGRWLSPDPGWFMFANMNNPQSLNLHSHALNSPLVWIDIDGLELVTVVTASGQRVVVDRSIAGDVISLVRAANNHGLMVTITSGFRSTQHQADMYNKWLASGKKGNPVGKPGGSGHNSGQAIDIHTSNLSQNDRFILGSIGLQYGLPYAGSQDTVHFGAGFGNPVDSQLVIENNANPNPDSTIVDGGVTTVNVTDSGTQIDTDNSTVIPDQITPIDTQNLDLTPQPLPPPPPPQDQQNQQ